MEKDVRVSRVILFIYCSVWQRRIAYISMVQHLTQSHYLELPVYSRRTLIYPYHQSLPLSPLPPPWRGLSPPPHPTQFNDVDAAFKADLDELAVIKLRIEVLDDIIQRVKDDEEAVRRSCNKRPSHPNPHDLAD